MRIFRKRRINRGRKSLVILCIILLGTSINNCKFPYEAEVDERTGLMVIEGGIVKGDTTQTITVSRSASLYAPEIKPVSACEVSVLDEEGTEFKFTETEEGVYNADVLKDQLVLNRNYFVRVITPNGNVYESDFEQLLPAAPVDSVYFIREPVPRDNGEMGEVNQFYIDLKGTEDESRYYMWKLSETFEYHSSGPIDYQLIYLEHAVYTDSMFINDTIFLPDTTIIIDTSWIETRVYIDSVISQPVFGADSMYTCWMSSDIGGLYSSSTINLESNAKKRIPLHAISTETDKLNVKYSLVVKQYSLSPNAYAFWNAVKIETQETGGLYTTQPGQVESNVRCISDENEEVLGYFWASSVASKRIFVASQSVSRYTYPHCELFLLEDRNMFEVYPVYIMSVPEYGYEFTTERQECMNCLLRSGGVNIKPVYWDDESYTVLIN